MHLNHRCGFSAACCGWALICVNSAVMHGRRTICHVNKQYSDAGDPGGATDSPVPQSYDNLAKIRSFER